MDNLIFGSDPLLVWRDIHRQDSDQPVARDVAERAVEFLYEPVTLHPDLTLGDVFKLLDACPSLPQVFRRTFAAQLCEEARKGPLPQSRGKDPVEVGEIEHLELCWSWMLDTSSRTYRSVQALDLHGIGSVLAVHVPSYGVKAGDRIKWSVSLTPVRQLLELPLRLSEQVTVTEDDIDAKGYGDVVATAKCSEVLLGQVIQAVLDEVAFHGGPEEQAEFKSELDARVAEVDDGTAKLISGDDIFAEFDRPGFNALFETLGDVPRTEVSQAMRQIGDDEAAGPFLSHTFGGKVVVTQQFRDRPGREFRRAFRAAGR